MRLFNILLRKIILISIFLSSLNSSISKVSIDNMESGQQNFINNYLRESQKKKEAINRSKNKIEVGYRDTSKSKSRYIRGQRLREVNKELEELRIENERLELENDILLSKNYKAKKITKSKRRAVKRKTHRVKKSKKSKRKYSKKKKYKSRKIFIKVNSRSKRMRIYRGNRLLYNWKISFKETLKKPKKYKRRTHNNSNYLYKYNKKDKIYFKNGRASKNFKIYNKKTLYSKIRLRRRYVNRLNKLIKQYGRRNVIIKIIR